MINKIKEFLTSSSDYYSNLISRKKRDMEIFSGNFWTDETIASTDRTGRICRSFSQYPKFCNAIVSPLSKSPYHADIEDNKGIYSKVQEELDLIENESNTKFAIIQAARHATITGVGAWILSTDNGKLKPEAVRDISMVAFDPNSQELDASDAEAGAIINYLSVQKARRLYGDDVVNHNETSMLSNIGSQWDIPNHSVPLITYYEINDEGTVDVYTYCGNKEVKEKVTLNISRIPIFRICFNEVVRNNKIDYNGIVDMTSDIQFGMNLGYSTLLERANRSPKASYLMPAKALDGLEEFYKKLHLKESAVALYNGNVPPTPIIEQYQTQDLMNTITTCGDLMSQVIGVPIGGINPAMNSMTATEVLVQQNNSESNVNSLYENTYNAVFSFTKTIIEELCWKYNIDTLPTFKLINGPSVITKLMKRRQELLAVSGLVDEKTKRIIAKSYIETLDKEISEPLLADVIANSPDIQFISDSNQDEDPKAVAILQNMNSVLEETQNELESQIQANMELKKEVDNLTMQLMNMKEQHLLDYQKHIDNMNIKQQELNLKAQESNANIQLKSQDNEYKAMIENTKLQKEMLDLEQKKLDIANDYLGG